MAEEHGLFCNCNFVFKKLMAVQYKIFFFLFSISFLFANPYPKELIIIGDSLTDSGNTRPLNTNTNMTGWYRFAPICDGETWPVHLSEKLKSNKILPSIRGGTNFAFSGALTSPDHPAARIDVFGTPGGPTGNPSMLEQVDFIYASINRENPVFVFGGANDILLDLNVPPIYVPDPVVDALRGVDDIEKIFTSLKKKGFSHLISINLPNAGRIPDADTPEEVALYETFTYIFNSTLEKRLSQLSFPVLQINMFAIANDLLDHPTKYGLLISDRSPQLPTDYRGGFPPWGWYPMNGEYPTGFVFWYDGVHLTEATNMIIADAVFSILSSAPSYAILAEIPFGILRAQNFSIKNQLYPYQPRCKCHKTYFFVTGNYEPLVSPALSSPYDRSLDSFGGTATLGFVNDLNENFEWGFAGSYFAHEKKCRYYDNRNNFFANGPMVSLFGNYKSCEGFCTLIYNTSWLFYSDIERKIAVGTYVDHVKGKTKGLQIGASATGNYYLYQSKNINFGSLVNLDFQKVYVSGYKESGWDLLAVKYRKQETESLVSGLGALLSLNYYVDCINLITNFFLTANKQWLGSKRDILFKQVNLGSSYGSWQVERSKAFYASGGFNFSTIFKNDISLSLGYNFNLGNHHTKEHFLSLALTLPIR